MIDRREQRYMGPAYSDDADYLLLNVPAGRMGAFVDDPEHFLKWAQCKGIRAEALQFLPRGLYRSYVLDLFQSLQRSEADGPRFEHLRGNVSDIERAVTARRSTWKARPPPGRQGCSHSATSSARPTATPSKRVRKRTLRAQSLEP
jgi:uncharacterized NAD(P)/FAD-binding protein YdhS